jgi:hypothetical protein
MTEFVAATRSVVIECEMPHAPETSGAPSQSAR